MRPSSNRTSIIPGTSSRDERKPRRSMPRRFATPPGVSPTIAIQAISGLFPRLARTEFARETRPFARSNLNRTFPSATEMLTSSIPGSRLTALVAFIAQSGQSIPVIPHSNSNIPSAANTKSATTSSFPDSISSVRSTSSRVFAATFFSEIREAVLRVFLDKLDINFETG